MYTLVQLQHWRVHMHVCVCVCAACLCIDRLRVGVVGREVEGHRAEDAELGGHLLHPPQSPLLLCVCKLHH